MAPDIFIDIIVQIQMNISHSAHVSECIKEKTKQNKENQ